MQHHHQHTPQGHVQTIQQHSRPSSVVHQQPSHQPPQAQSQTLPSPAAPVLAHEHDHAPHASAQQQSQPQYHSAYQPPSQAGSRHTPDLYSYQPPYNAQDQSSGYTPAEMMATTMPRAPYPPPMSYHTPQSNSPTSVGSASGHDQQRSMYGQPPMHQQQMYYGQHQQYHAPSPYGQHAHTQHQPMGSQPGMMMSHGAPSPVPHQMAAHPSQHSPAQGMTSSPRYAKMEIPSLTPQLSRQGPPAAPSPLSASQVQANMPPQGMHQGLSHQSQPMHPHPSQHSQHPQHPQHMQHPQHQPPAPQHPQHSAHTPQTGSPLPSGQTGSANSSVVNANAAPGPIPATTPLVVRQDQNGVQWIAFEYSRDRVKMEYTIRCDVESVRTDELAADFKTENCVYPRALCPRDQYRGNRLQYESECNTVGWALAQLNPSLRGKRGLIQRAVDSWRNSNQDTRLRSRRVRRMAKIGTRKASSANGAASSNMNAGMGQPSPAHLGPSTIPSAGPPMGKPMHQMHQMHHHHDASAPTGEEVAESEDSFADENQHHHVASGAVAAVDDASGLPTDARPAQVFSPYGGYVSGAPLPPVTSSNAMVQSSAGGATTVKKVVPQPEGLFPDVPEAKKRKFVLVEERGSRVRVRVTLNMVDTSEIPDSFRRSNAVHPASFFPIEMESPPPSPTGRRFFLNDMDDVEDLSLNNDGDEVEAATDTTGRRSRRQHNRRRLAMAGGSSSLANASAMESVPASDGGETQVAVPRMRKSLRRKQVRLNDLGSRMAWLHSRVFAGRRMFLQKALDTYRGKTCNGIQAAMLDVSEIAPHFELRVGKKQWMACERELELRQLGH